MNFAHWRDLAVLSVRNPAQAARDLMAMGLPRDTLWTALALVAVLNTILFSLSRVIAPGPSPFPAILNSPIVYFLLVVVGLVLTIYALFWVGRGLGGKGSLDDVMVLVIWLQVLRVVVQAATMVLLLTIPILSALLVLASAIIGMYMLVHFINQAHRLESNGRSIGVLIAAMVAIVLGLSLILSLIGAPMGGVPGYV